MTNQIAIYGLFNGRRCMYVGQSRNPITRLVAHKTWFKERFHCAPRLEIFKWVAKGIALSAERECILAFRKHGEAELNIRPQASKRNFVKVSVDINSRVLSLIKREAKKQNRSVSYLVRLWLEKKFGRNGKATK